MRLLKSIFCFVLISIVIVPVESFAATSEKYDPIQTALALNYAMVSLYKVVSYNDVMILKQEYDNIINNIDLSKIEDEEIVDLFTNLMDTLTRVRISDKDKEFIQKRYQRKVENALSDAFSGGMGSVGASAMSIGNPFVAGAEALSSIGSSYFDYRRCLDEYKDQRDENEWKIDSQVLLDLNNIRKHFFIDSWRLIKRYNFPDQWRLTENQVKEYVEILKDKNLARRSRRLKRLETSFEAYPPFWFYLGKTMQELGNKKEALEYYKQFDEKRKGIFRKDPFLVSTYMNQIVLLDGKTHADEIRTELQKLVENSRDTDWNNFLFAALEYAKLGDYENAKNLIQRNIDNSEEVSLNMRLLGVLMAEKQSPHTLDKLIDQMIANDAVKNEDILYLFGRTNDDFILKKMKNQIFAIKPSVDDHIIGKDDIEITMPMKWLLEDLHPAIEFAGKKFGDPDIKADPKHKLVSCTFKDVFDASAFIKNGKETETDVFLKDKSFPVRVVFLTKAAEHPKEKSIGKKSGILEETKGFVSKWSRNIGGAIDRVYKPKVQFQMSKIFLNGKEFEVKNSRILYSKR